MFDEIPAGLPDENEYRLLIQSDRFKAVEQFSDSFLSQNSAALERYAEKWVRDPLHQWSRQWEYPYVLSRVEADLPPSGEARLLDAGSGITFFPYYLKALHPQAEMHCVDNDEMLVETYRDINARGRDKVEFSCGDLRKLEYPAEWFDVIYCISVLEHTGDYPEIIKGFYRLLRPGGKLVITFDISVDGMHDINIRQAEVLLNALRERFLLAEETPTDLAGQLARPGLFTTHSARKIDPALLPWRTSALRYRLKAIVTGKPFGVWPPLLTVFCLNLSKPVDSPGSERP